MMLSRANPPNRGSTSSGSSGSSGAGSKPTRQASSLLIPANPALADPGSSPISRGGILLNPLNGPQAAAGAKSPPSSTSSLVGSLGASLRRKGSDATSSNASETGDSFLSGSSTSTSGGGSQAHTDGSTTSVGTAGSALPSPSPKLKFAPLPESGRKRSSSITLGVAARAQMLAQQPGTQAYNAAQAAAQQQQQQQQTVTTPSAPHWQQQMAPVRPFWYNNGAPMPDNVKTVHDIKPGLKKVFNKMRRSSSTSRRTSSTDSTPPAEAATKSLAERAAPVPQSTDTPAPVSSSGSGGAGQRDSIPEEEEGQEGANESALSLSESGSSAGDLEEDMLVGSGGDDGALRGRQMERGGPGSGQGSMLFGSDSDVRMSSPSNLHSGEGDYGVSGGGGGGGGMGDATPRRRASPTGQHSHPHQVHSHLTTPYMQGISQTGSLPGSGANTPRRRMSMTDLHTPLDQGHESARFNRHHQAVFGYDESTLNKRLSEVELGGNRRPEWSTQHGTSAGGARDQDDDDGLESVTSREEKDDDDEVPIPDSRQVHAGEMEVVEPSHGSARGGR